MFLIPLFLAFGLDLSRPEFIPETFKGDYIVGSVSGNDFEVDSISADSLSFTKASADVRSIDVEQTESDYWNILLSDEFEYVPVSSSVTTSVDSSPSFYLSSSGIVTSQPSRYFNIYFPVTNGDVVELSSIKFDHNFDVACGILDSYSSNATVTGLVAAPRSQFPNGVTGTSGANGTGWSFTYTCQSDGVFVLTLLLAYYYEQHNLWYGAFNDNSWSASITRDVGFTNLFSLQNAISDSLSNVSVSVGDVEVNLDDLNDKLDELSDVLHIKLKALLFVSLMAFLYPLAMAIVHNVVGGKKDV